MIDDLPAAPDPVTDTPAVFSQKAAAFVLAQKAMVPQINATVTNMNAIAAGGAYALPYTFDGTSGTAGDPGSGKLRLSGLGTQSISTAMYLSTVNSLGQGVAPTLATFDDSTSTITGVLKLYKQGDASKWLRFSVTAVTTGAYYTITLLQLNGSASSPFVNGDSLLLDFQRTGDKGDTGPSGVSLTPILHVIESASNGVSAANASGVGLTYTRTLNSVVKNTIGGVAAVASNQITLPAGTYRVTGSVPAWSASGQQAWLYNVTTGQVMLYGSSAFDTSGFSVSILMREIILSVQSTLEIRQYISSSSASLGKAAGGGGGEIYTQVFFEKVA